MIISKERLVWALAVFAILYFFVDIAILRVIHYKTDLIVERVDLVAESCAANDARLTHLERLAH